MYLDEQTCLTIAAEKDVIDARQLMRDIAVALDFSADKQSKLVTVISELSQNVWTYAPGGEVCVHILEEAYRVGVRITARDQGPGIANIREVMNDWQAISHSLGAGLLGIQRLVDDFYIDSSRDNGTEVTAITWLNTSVTSV